MADETPINDLSQINKKILAEGETLPKVKLKGGIYVQTGTVATMLHNIKLFNNGDRRDIAIELELAIPTLYEIGLFELFKPHEWLDEKNPGKKFVGIKAKEFIDKIEKNK